MFKKFLIPGVFSSCFLLFLFAGCGSSKKSTSDKDKYSAFTSLFLQKMEMEFGPRWSEKKLPQLPAKLQEQFLLKNQEGLWVVHGMIQVSPQIDEKKLADLHVKINSRIGQNWTVVIPVVSIQPLNRITGVNTIAIDAPVNKRNK